MLLDSLGSKKSSSVEIGSNSSNENDGDKEESTELDNGWKEQEEPEEASIRKVHKIF
jgi:hypothetical protein